MLTYFDILQKRRSIRSFAPRAVEREKRELLLEAALRAPSSRGHMPWEFVVVEDPQLLQQLGHAKLHGSLFLASAPLAIVVAADPDKCDVWVEDLSIAAILIQLAATALELGSCWAQIRLRDHNESGYSANDYLADLLNLPGHYQVGSIIGVGYPAEDKPGHAREELDWDKLHADQFGVRLS